MNPISTISVGRNAAHPQVGSQLLDDESRAQALALLREIVSVVPDPENVLPTVADGAGGHALFLAYAALADCVPGVNRDDLLAGATAQLQSAADRIQNLGHYPFLYQGFAGVAWAVNHLHRLGVLDDAGDLLDAVDEAALDWLQQGASSMLCELIAGLAGIGVYGLARAHTPGGRKITQRVVDALAATAVEHQGHRTWFNPPENSSELTRHAAPQGCFNLGLSHGVPGAVAFLSKAAARGFSGAAALAHDAGEWLLRQRRRYANGSVFAAQFLNDPETESEGSRLAWCYGDLGVSAALMVSARALRRADWEASAREIAAAAARREGARVMDGGLCHGAFGNAHLFHRFYRATGDAVFADAARHWLQTGFALRQPGRPLAGYPAWVPGPGEVPVADPWVADSGMLEGISGIGLVLLAFLSRVAPDWDEFMLVDIPPLEA